jgi:hypothetical protein
MQIIMAVTLQTWEFNSSNNDVSQNNDQDMC